MLQFGIPRFGIPALGVAAGAPHKRLKAKTGCLVLQTEACHLARHFASATPDRF